MKSNTLIRHAIDINRAQTRAISVVVSIEIACAGLPLSDFYVH